MFEIEIQEMHQLCQKYMRGFWYFENMNCVMVICKALLNMPITANG